MEMEAECAPAGQQITADNMQQAVAQTVRQLVAESVRQVEAESLQEETRSRILENTGPAVSIKKRDEEQATCSSAAEAGVSKNAHRIPKSRQRESTSWHDDEQEYKAQMNLLNADWEKPEVDAVMKLLLKGQLSIAEAADKISIILGRDVAVASVRNRALEFAHLPTKTNVQHKRVEEKPANLPDQKHPLAKKEFGPGIYEVIRNVRGYLNSIAIKEPHGDCVRIYRRSTTRYYYSYYRCSTCDHLSQRSKSSLYSPPVIKMVREDIVGEPFPPHLPDCKAMPLSQLRAMQIDRENRQEVIERMQTPFEAWSKGRLRALLEEAKRASQLKHHHRKRKRSSSRQEGDDHFFGVPHGETLTSYEERVRRMLDDNKISRPASPASSIVSERLVPRTPDDKWRAAKRPRLDSTTTVGDDLQSLFSDLSEAPDADGLLPEERAHIERLRVPGKRKDDEVLSTQGDSGELVSDASYVYRRIPAGNQSPPVSEAGTEADTNVDNVSVASFDTFTSDIDRRKRLTLVRDETGREIIRETKRKLFMVDDEHLLNLFRRCPNCGEQMRSLVLSSRSGVPIITYSCRGSCEKTVWLGYEPK